MGFSRSSWFTIFYNLWVKTNWLNPFLFQYTLNPVGEVHFENCQVSVKICQIVRKSTVVLIFGLCSAYSAHVSLACWGWYIALLVSALSNTDSSTNWLALGVLNAEPTKRVEAMQIQAGKLSKQSHRAKPNVGELHTRQNHALYMRLRQKWAEQRPKIRTTVDFF